MATYQSGAGVIEVEVAVICSRDQVGTDRVPGYRVHLQPLEGEHNTCKGRSIRAHLTVRLMAEDSALSAVSCNKVAIGPAVRQLGLGLG